MQQQTQWDNETWIESSYDESSYDDYDEPSYDDYDESSYDDQLWGRIEKELNIQGIYDSWIKEADGIKKKWTTLD